MSNDHTYTVDFSSLVGSKPQRVVSLVPSITESLFDLQLGSHLVAVTDYCEHPAEGVAKLPKVGGTKNPDIQKIVALNPDLVCMNDEENRQEDAKALSESGVKVWVTGPRTVAEAINVLWDIVAIFDVTTMVPRIQQIDRVFDMVSQVAASGQRVRTFVPIWKDPWMTINAKTYVHDLLFNLGAENVFAERERQFPLAADTGTTTPLASDDPRIAGRDTRYPRITLEEMVAAKPQLILLPTEPYAFTEDDARALYALDTPAAINGHIFLIDGSLLTWHGTRLGHTLQELPPLIDEVRASLGLDEGLVEVDDVDENANGDDDVP